jgi:hypothetical protein
MTVKQTPKIPPSGLWLGKQLPPWWTIHKPYVKPLPKLADVLDPRD